MIITMICTDSFDLFVARYTSIKTRPSIQRFCETWFLHVVTRQKKKKDRKVLKGIGQLLNVNKLKQQHLI